MSCKSWMGLARGEFKFIISFPCRKIKNKIHLHVHAMHKMGGSQFSIACHTHAHTCRSNIHSSCMGDATQGTHTTYAWNIRAQHMELTEWLTLCVCAVETAELLV